jgi:hypothetical protein
MKARPAVLFCASVLFFGCVVVTTGGKPPPGANPGEPAPGDPASGSADTTAQQPSAGASCLGEGEFPDGRPTSRRGRSNIRLDDPRCCSGKLDPAGRCKKERAGHACNDAHACEKGSSCTDGKCCLGLGVSMDAPGAIGMAPAGSQCCEFLHINPLKMAQQPVQCVQITKGPPGAACKDNLECDSLYCRAGKCLSKSIAVGAHCGAEEDVKIGRGCGELAECGGVGATAKCVLMLRPSVKVIGGEGNCRANGARCSPTAGPSADPYGRTPCCGFCGQDGACH